MASSVFNPPTRISGESHVTSMGEYRRMHEKSVEEPAEFWAEIAEKFHWDRKPKKEDFFKYNFDHRKGEMRSKVTTEGKYEDFSKR